MRQVRRRYPAEPVVHWIHDGLATHLTAEVHAYAAVQLIDLVPRATQRAG